MQNMRVDLSFGCDGLFEYFFSFSFENSKYINYLS